MRLEDLKSVDWWETIKLTLARGFFSGLIVLLLLAINEPDKIPPISAMLSWLAMWTVGGMAFVLGMQLMVRIMAWMGLGGLALIAMALPYWIAAVALALGDPIIWLITKTAPGVFNVANFRPFNLSPLIWVRRAAPTVGAGFPLPRSWTQRDPLG